MVWVAGVVYAVAVVAAAGGLTRALMEALLHVDAMAAWQPWTGFSTADITDGTIATVLGVMGFFLIFAAFGHLLVMLTRAGALLVLAATNPIAAAGLVWEGGRSWFWKAFRWFHAAAFTPVIMMLMLGLGVQVTSHVALSATDTLQKAIGTAVPGVMLILVGCFAPWPCSSCSPSSTPAPHPGPRCAPGWPLRAVCKGCCAAAAPTSPPTPPRAATQRPLRQGEASTEAATSQRFANSAGGFMGALGASRPGRRNRTRDGRRRRHTRRHPRRRPDQPDGGRPQHLHPRLLLQPLPRPQQRRPQRSGQPRDQRLRTRLRRGNPHRSPTDTAHHRPCLKPRRAPRRRPRRGQVPALAQPVPAEPALPPGEAQPRPSPSSPSNAKEQS
jgi:hypothetical protein